MTDQDRRAIEAGLLKACEYGGVGMGEIILLHNAAGVLEEVGCKELAEGLKVKSRLEFAAVMNVKSADPYGYDAARQCASAVLYE